MNRKIVNIFYPSVPTQVLGAQWNRLIEMVLLSTHNIRGVKFHLQPPALIGKLLSGSGK